MTQKHNLQWVGSSRDDLKEFPNDIREEMGYALYLAQCGEKSPDAKPMKGFLGAGVLEIVENFNTDTYRAIYTVRFKGTVYVLHAFQKKSKSGIATPKKDIDLIHRRLKAAEEHHKGFYEKEKKMDNHAITASTGNVFEDLGFSDAEEMSLKAELSRKISSIIQHKHLSQVQAASLLGIDQPKISALMKGKLSGFSVERLFRFLTILGRDIQILIKPKSRKRLQGRVEFQNLHA